MFYHHFYALLNWSPSLYEQQDNGKQIQDIQICKITVNGKLYNVFTWKLRKI